MALPVRKTTSSKRRKRSSHFALKSTNLAVCPKCKQPKLQHNACANCGTYGGRQVLKLDNPLDKKGKAKK
ncbi:MAG: 50S ribosomal protein L32 [Patescibacteria group bacterium]|nr:50S ribosomal protein L32 [Patescibacteria group bacterium]